MPSAISVTATFHLVVVEAVPLVQVTQHRAQLLVRGVYFLVEGAPSIVDFNPYSNAVVYIGKAIGETIFSRCRKHLAAFRDERHASGVPSMRPGKSFKEYRSVIGGGVENLFIFHATMDATEPYLISCAEEYLLHEYAKQNGKKPRANTK